MQTPRHTSHPGFAHSRVLAGVLGLFALALAFFTPLSSNADEPAPAAVVAAAPAAAAAAPSAADLEKRIADLEAYVNNGARVDGATSKVAGAGPGHNGWLMVCAALVLIMTLPGLALFYGGLVRTKNVLSVMAQCLGLSGIVTLLWWRSGTASLSHRVARSWGV